MAWRNKMVGNMTGPLHRSTATKMRKVDFKTLKILSERGITVVGSLLQSSLPEYSPSVSPSVCHKIKKKTHRSLSRTLSFKIRIYKIYLIYLRKKNRVKGEGGLGPSFPILSKNTIYVLNYHRERALVSRESTFLTRELPVRERYIHEWLPLSDRSPSACNNNRRYVNYEGKSELYRARRFERPRQQ